MRAMRMSTQMWPFLGVAALSVFWSEDPWVTGRYIVLLAAYMFTVGFLTDRLGPERLLHAALNYVAIILIVSTALAIVLPDIGRHSPSDVAGLAHVGKWRGIFAYKNGLGPYACLGVALFFTHGKLLTGFQPYLWLARVCALLCLVFSQSSTAVAGIAGMLFIYWLVSQKRPLSFGMILALCAFAVTLLAYLSAGVAEVLGRDATFTGRTVIWERVIEVWSESPLLGYGYAAGNENVLAPRLIGGVFESAVDSHNAYLDLMIDLGLIGLAAFLYGVLRALYIGLSSIQRTRGSERDAFTAMVMILISGCVIAVSEVSPFRLVGNGGATCLFSLIACAYLRARRPAELARSVSHPAPTHLAEVYRKPLEPRRGQLKT
jgi:O-antigen ligase